MLNNITLVGRIANELEIKENENGVKQTIVTLAVPRSYKNVDGIYETDFIPCMLYKGTAEQTVEWCKKGDLIAVKGRIQMQDDNMQIIAERISFLSTKKADE